MREGSHSLDDLELQLLPSITLRMRRTSTVFVQAGRPKGVMAGNGSLRRVGLFRFLVNHCP